MQNKSIKWIALLMLAALALAGAARATQVNYQNYLLGERAAGMGGGVNALAADSDACYYNPAGLVRTTHNTLSLSANLYGMQHYFIDDAFYPDEDLDSTSFQTIPSTVSAIRRVNTNLTTAFSVFVPQQGAFSETHSFPENNHYYSMSDNYQALYVGPSLGYRLAPAWSLGASLFAVYHSRDSLQNLFWGDQALSFTRDYHTRSYSLLAMLALQYRIDDRWSAGLSYAPPSMLLTGNGEWMENIVRVRNRRSVGDAASIDDLDAEYRVPGKISAGLGWENPKVAACGLDVTYHFSTDYDAVRGTTDDGDDFSVPIHTESAWDVNLGGEYYVRAKYPLRAGFFTSRSLAPSVNLDESYNMTQIDLYGLTCSVGVESGHMATNLGLNYVFGSGESTGWRLTGRQVEPAVVDAREEDIYLVFNTSYFF